MKIKEIFLDFEGVISHNGQFIHTDVYDLVKDKMTYEELNERYSKARTSEISFEEFEKDFPVKWLEKSLEKVAFHKGAKEFLIWAKGKYPLFIASNNIPVLCEKEIDKLNIKEYFVKIFISCYMKKRKPNEDFFEEVSKACKKPISAIFVDDAKKNLITAKKIGFTTVWVNNAKTVIREDRRNLVDYKPDYEITDLMEIKKILEKID
jgi:HAD superfamily hydrolase (TIGR01509 family)